MTVLPPDPYKALGVSKDAQVSEIKSAHRKLVLKCHPDKVQDPALKALKQDEFQKVQQAYELLSDERERRKYDDQVKLVELRKQFQTKANISTPRSSPKEFNVYTAEPPEPIGRSPPPRGHSYSRSWEEELGRGPRIFDATPPRSSRREGSYAERPSKREAEREREREREARERDKDRERRRKAEDARRAEKDAKEQRRADKNKREKLRDKEIKREADEKKRYAKPYIESFDDDIPPSKSDKKKSSSSKRYEKFDEARDRSSSQEDMPSPSPSTSHRLHPKMGDALSHIERTRGGAPPALQRSKTYHPRNLQPPAPTPPPMTSSASPFVTPDDDVRRSSGRTRREVGDSPRIPRDKPFRTSSREMVEEPLVMNASPTSRHAAQFSKSSATPPMAPSSPPRREIPRTSSMPVDASYVVRPVPGVARSQSFNIFADGTPRGRDRSRLHPQIQEESDSDDVYERHARDNDHKYRSTRQYRAAEPENISRYQVDNGRAKLQGTYSRRLDSEMDPHRYYSTSGGIPVVENRPPPPARESSYGNSGMKFPKVKTSKAYGYDDVKYSSYEKPYREGYAAYA
ncbi:hypothetical protein HIM_02873 [Hirsutella minnesotensis 3608]|nr:hypothetical protein HIM_02873 [Hirsutella minnesotensis 3608]